MSSQIQLYRYKKISSLDQVHKTSPNLHLYNHVMEENFQFLEAKVGIEKLNKLTLGSKILDYFPHSVLKVKVYLLAVKNVFL